MERVRNREREQAQHSDPFNRGLSILFASKHPQNTRTLFCLSSSKPASLSSSPMPHLPLPFSLISCFSFFSPPLLNSLPSSLSLCSRYGTSFSIFCSFLSGLFLTLFTGKLKQRDGGMGRGSGHNGFEPGSP